VENIKGETMVNPAYTVWVDQSNTGWNRKNNVPRLGRAVLAALLKKDVDGDISFGDDVGALIGLQMEVYMGVVTKNGKEKNVLVDINPVK